MDLTVTHIFDRQIQEPEPGLVVPRHVAVPVGRWNEGYVLLPIVDAPVLCAGLLR
jgi:hypothetical protein